MPFVNTFMNLTYSYRGNANLRPAGYKHVWTQEHIDEVLRCRKDPIYFIEKYVKIISQGKLSNFDLYDWQKDIILDFVNHNRVIINTARQVGKSSITVAFILWLIIFHSTKTAAIVANKEDVAKEMIWRIQFAYEQLPFWLQQGVKEWNKKSLELENGSRVFAAATSASSISGFTVDFLMCDEAAKVEGWSTFWTATAMTLSSNPEARIALVSSPLGLNHFFDFFTKAQKGLNGYRWHKITWDMIPGRNEQWRLQTLADLMFDEDKFAQEQRAEFMGSSGTLISGKKLKELAEQSVRPIVSVGGVRQYEPALPGHRYLIVADVAEGKGLDYSACQVFDITAMPYRQVCVFQHNGVTAGECAQILDQLGRLYNSARILVDSNNIGSSVVNELWETFEYDNVLFTRTAKKKGGRARAGTEVLLGAMDGAEGGVKTNASVKSIGCNLTKHLIEQDKLIIRDTDTVMELATFSRKLDNKGYYGKTFQAEAGKHDDLVMGCVLFAWLTETDMFREHIHTMKHLKDRSEQEMDDTLRPFMFTADGRGDNEDETMPALWRPEEETPNSEELKNWPDVWTPDGFHRRQS